MKRRTLIIAGVGVTVAAGATVAVARRLSRPALAGVSEAARELGHDLWARLPSLEIEEAAFVSFLTDLETHDGPIEPGARATDKVVQKFLLSTDFFLEGGDETRTIAYARYHDPYISVCYDPINQGRGGAEEG